MNEIKVGSVVFDDISRGGIGMAIVLRIDGRHAQLRKVGGDAIGYAPLDELTWMGESTDGQRDLVGLGR